MLAAALRDADLRADPSAFTPATDGTVTTFLGAEVVIKLYGADAVSARSATAEVIALKVLAGQPVAAPALIAAAPLTVDDVPYQYVAMTCLKGRPFPQTTSTSRPAKRLAAVLGEQLRGLQQLDATALPDLEAWDPWPLEQALSKTCLPTALLEQADAFCSRYRSSGDAFTHSDLMYRHVLVQEDESLGIIDWGDATRAPWLYELAKLQLDLFAADRSLLRECLAGMGRSLSGEDARQAMALALRRQAVGLRQHRGAMDVFHRLPEALNLSAIDTLEALADR